MSQSLASLPPPPVLCEAPGSTLDLDSTLAHLPLYRCSVSSQVTGLALADWFASHPRVPGAIAIDANEDMEAAIPRQRLLELAVRPGGPALLGQPLSALRGYLYRDDLVLSAGTSILQAMQRALRRSPELLGDPIVVRGDDGAYLIDIHTLNIAYWQLRGIETQVRYERMQLRAVQMEKMASLGRLVDGVTHQILDPVGFIWGNLSHVANYGDRLLALIAAYERWTEAHDLPPSAEIDDLADEIDLEFAREDLPRAIASIRSGAERLKAIVSSLQNFCHLDEVYPKPADLHQHLDSIIMLLQTRLEAPIEFVRDYETLPPVPCYIGQLDRAFATLLSQAADALLERAVRQQTTEKLHPPSSAAATEIPTRPRIEIATRTFADETDRLWVSVAVADNGPGLSPEQRDALQASFSTGRRSGRETDLSASYDIVTARHGGRFLLRDRPGGGTVFEVQLPLT